MAKFPERLKQLREEAHMTQTDLAVKLGLSNGAIGNYEAGSRGRWFKSSHSDQNEIRKSLIHKGLRVSSFFFQNPEKE